MACRSLFLIENLKLFCEELEHEDGQEMSMAE